MPPGLVIIVAVLMALGMPRSRLRSSVPDASRRASHWHGGYGCGSGDTMCAFTASDRGPAGLGPAR